MSKPATKDQKKQFQAARQEFRDMSLSELKGHETTFSTYDKTGDGFINLQELQYLMEKMGMPQTHMGLKAMIKEVDEDSDGQMSYREFLLIFKFAKEGKLVSQGLQGFVKSICVADEGVGGAKSFFEKKANDLNNNTAAMDEAYRKGIKDERDKLALGKAEMKRKSAMFGGN